MLHKYLFWLRLRLWLWMRLWSTREHFNHTIEFAYYGMIGRVLASTQQLCALALQPLQLVVFWCARCCVCRCLRLCWRVLGDALVCRYA